MLVVAQRFDTRVEKVLIDLFELRFEFGIGDLIAPLRRNDSISLDFALKIASNTWFIVDLEEGE